MTTAVVSGAGFGLGLALFLLGLVPQRRTMLSVLAELDAGEATEMRSGLGLAEPGLERLVRAAYDLLGLITFFTAHLSPSRCQVQIEDDKSLRLTTEFTKP